MTLSNYKMTQIELQNDVIELQNDAYRTTK